MDHISSHCLWKPPDQLNQPFPQLNGNSSHSSMHPVLKVAGAVHIWYYIPLCTIFAQQFNGDVFRTKFHNSKSSVIGALVEIQEWPGTQQSGNSLGRLQKTKNKINKKEFL
ncbi:hypothetical protein O181_132094 [Austropuccinia psidii MF-1]|uniref:Uncharacterized protein n=1 Tax=Austropuccinia psidii MF-1 TaxID=1389203 RepID=A0A9Q3L483_9BASI|nr:hypothetical protein [Austropuccinia psidii MF-1]